MDIGMPVSLIGAAMIALIFFLVLLDNALYDRNLSDERSIKGKGEAESLIYFLVLLNKALHYTNLPDERSIKSKTEPEEYKKAA
jgi:hypothetical protein